MKAVILVGGKATRLEPLTVNTPKAMVPVLNTPFLEQVIHLLSRHQVKEMVMAQGHLAQPIEGYFGDGSRFGVRLYYSIEDSPLGSAGAAKNAEKYLDGTFLVVNGDIVTDLDITAMTDFHEQRKAKVTIAFVGVDDPTSFGLVDSDGRGRVTRFLEKPKPEEVTTNMINAGAWLVEPDVLARIPTRAQFSFERDLFPQLLVQGDPVYAYPLSGYWMDMGTPEKYLQLHRDLLSGRSRQYAPAENIPAGAKTAIHPTAEVSGQVMLGADCSIGPRVKLTGPVVIGDGCSIGEGCLIEDSVIWQKTVLGPGVSLKGCIVADNCRMSAGSSGEGVVMGDRVTVANNRKLETYRKIWPGTTIEGES